MEAVAHCLFRGHAERGPERAIVAPAPLYAFGSLHGSKLPLNAAHTLLSASPAGIDSRAIEGSDDNLGGGTQLHNLQISTSIAAALAVVIAQRALAWQTDIRHQTLSARPRLETRYTSARRTGFTIEAESYRLVADLKSDSGHRITNTATNGRNGFGEIMAGRGAYLALFDASGTQYTSLRSTSPSRINIYRRGPYYIETHWLEVALTSDSGEQAPIKGEIVFYAYPEKLHIGVILHVTGDIQVKDARFVWEFQAEGCSTPATHMSGQTPPINQFVLIKRSDNKPTCALIYPVANGVDDVVLEKEDGLVRVSNFIYSQDAHEQAVAAWKAGDKPAAYFELFPLESSAVTEEMEGEIQPIMSVNAVASEGRWLGYDPVRGCYVIETDNPGDFTYHYHHPNDYEKATFTIRNGYLRRKVYVLHKTRRNPGLVECGVVLDEAGNTLPITVQISKNFSGEKEEPFYNPQDTPFSETIFPLYLEPNEERKVTSLHLYQNWGSHPLKQFSSLGAWMDYYHMSTGVTETTCYVPFLFGGLDGVCIADLRPMSQPMWKSQPQHDNVAGHSFLRYCDSDGIWHFVEYLGTAFRSTGPNWADVTLSYLSDDGKAKVTLDIFELPQTDELRNFIHMRIDFLGPIKIKDGDFSRYMRLLNVASWVQRLRYTHVAYGGPEGEPTVASIRLNDDFTLVGAPIPSEGGFATIYPDKRGANAFIVRRFEGRIGGKTAAPGVSVIGQKNGDTILMLVPITDASEISAGDWLEVDLFLMPYGGGTQDWKPAQKAAFDYGPNSPRVTEVTVGTKVSDFPARIRVDENGVAEFRIAGGFDVIPIIVEGTSGYICQRLYSLDGEKKSLIDHAQKGARDGYQVFAQEDGKYGWVFLFKTDGRKHAFRTE